MSKIQGTLAQWRDRLRRKELSPAELVNLTADAIEADRTTNAYISFDREAALHAAAGADISSPLAAEAGLVLPGEVFRGQMPGAQFNAAYALENV